MATRASALRRSNDPRAVDAFLGRQPWDRLRPPLEAAGADVATAFERLRLYARMLLEWNRGASNLIAHSDEARFVERHLLESLEPAAWLKESDLQRWIDFGSGGGLPAIPLVIAGVGTRWTLVESRRRKTLFLRKFIQDSGLREVEVVNDRLENVVAEAGSATAWDGFTSRATMTLGPTLNLATSLVVPGGAAFLWKGSGREEELTKAENLESSWSLEGEKPLGPGPGAVLKFVRL